jgi:hypothetical protein
MKRMRNAIAVAVQSQVAVGWLRTKSLIHRETGVFLSSPSRTIKRPPLALRDSFANASIDEQRLQCVYQPIAELLWETLAGSVVARKSRGWFLD